MRPRYQALGRLKTGERNRTEGAYEQHLEGRKLLKEVAWYRFEGLKLRLADGCFYTPDFAVMLTSGQLECHEVKGKSRKTAKDGTRYDAPFAQDDSKAKIRVAAEMYPIVFRMCYPATGGGWHTEEI